jgi:hypothetical protein
MNHSNKLSQTTDLIIVQRWDLDHQFPEVNTVHTHDDFPKVSIIWWTLPLCVHTGPFNVTGLVFCLTHSNRARLFRFPGSAGTTSLKNSSAMSPSSSTRSLSEYHFRPFAHRDTNLVSGNNLAFVLIPYAKSHCGPTSITSIVFLWTVFKGCLVEKNAWTYSCCNKYR